MLICVYYFVVFMQLLYLEVSLYAPLACYAGSLRVHPNK